MKATSVYKRYPRWKRKRQILKILYYWGKDTLTMSQVAFWLEGACPSNHILKIMHEMEAEKMITSRRLPYRSNATKLNWAITDVGIRVVHTLMEAEGSDYAL